MSRIKYEHQNRTDVNEAGLLWDSIISESRVDRFHEKIVPHAKSVLFGYADVTIVVETKTGVKFPIKLRGLVVKSIKGKAHVDMPAERNGGDFFDIYMPRSAALRAVLTTFIFNDDEVKQTVANAANAPTDEVAAEAPAAEGEVEAPALEDGNPFACEA